MKNTLTIAIPTYNRANRLDKALQDLLLQILGLGSRIDLVSVLVSNNGSSDSTQLVMNKHEKIFRHRGVRFSQHHFNVNHGFDQNVLKCYESCGDEYVWFLSDDDNVIDNAISEILDDISRWQPQALYYNFGQPPFTESNPYLDATVFFQELSTENIGCLKKIIDWPKLTSIVLKASPDLSPEIQKLDLGFMHVAIFLDRAIKYGSVLFSRTFVARPDPDYRDHINFPPFIANNLQDTLHIVLGVNDRSELMAILGLKRIDPLISSLLYLGAAYRGKMTIPDALRQFLFKTIRSQLTWQGLRQRHKGQVLISIGKFTVSYLYHLYYSLLLVIRAAGRSRS